MLDGALTMRSKTNSYVITANELLDGDAIFYTANGAWSHNIGSAFVFDTADAAESELQVVSKRDDHVIGIYSVEVSRTEGDIPVPLHFREVFRTKGPSNYFHGKQAEV